jgi:hypothetical protein
LLGRHSLFWGAWFRWFALADVGEVPEAKFLDIILYSREQLHKEYLDMPTDAKGSPDELPAAPWGIISIKAQVLGMPLHLTLKAEGLMGIRHASRR